MKIYEFVMEKELASKTYYENLSHCAEHPGIKKIFAMLAEEEQKHYDTVKNMKGFPGMKDATDVLKTATDFLVSTFKENQKVLCDFKTLEAYRHAIKMEEESIRLYGEAMAGASENEEILTLLLEQEEGHKLLLENIIEFVTKPERTLEDAEFARSDPNF